MRNGSVGAVINLEASSSVAGQNSNSFTATDCGGSLRKPRYVSTVFPSSVGRNTQKASSPAGTMTPDGEHSLSRPNEGEEPVIDHRACEH